MIRRLSAVVVALLLWAQPATATVNLIAHVAWKAPAATSSGVTTTGATVMIVDTSEISGPATVSDTCGASTNYNTWLPLNTINSGARNTKGYYVIAPNTCAAGAHTFTIAGGAGFNGAVMLAFDPTSPVFDGQTAGASSAGTTVQPGSLTPGGPTNLLICILGGDGNTSFAIDSGFTIGDTSTYSAGVALSASVAYLEQASGTAQNPTWTVGANSSVILSNLVSFTFTGGGGGSPASGPTPCTLRLLGVGCDVQ